MNEILNSIDVRLAIPVLAAFLPRLLVALFILFAFWIGYRVTLGPIHCGLFVRLPRACSHPAGCWPVRATRN